jgi:glycosyltransferase involved in cell wall biosynthesis
MKSVCMIVENQSFGGMEVHTLGLMESLIERGYGIDLISNRYRGYDVPVVARGWQESVRIIHTDLEGILYGGDSNRKQWKHLFSKLRSRVLIFPRGDSNYGQAGFLRSCRETFDWIVFVDHLEARPRPVSSRRWLGVLPGLGLWWHKRRILSKRGSRHADKIVAVSQAVKQRLVNDLGYTGDKIVVVHNGVSWRKYRRDEVRGMDFRDKHAIPRDAFVFGMLGRLSEQKGIDLALRALALLKCGAGGTPFLVVAGEGALLGSLRKLACELGIEHQVIFLGFVNEPTEVLSGYDVILFSSRNEGLPLGLLEGMAMGCIPIVTRIGGMLEVVTSAEIGRVVAPEDPSELGAAMLDIFRLDAVSVARMRERAVMTVREKFDIAESHRKILEVCRLDS